MAGRCGSFDWQRVDLRLIVLPPYCDCIATQVGYLAGDFINRSNCLIERLRSHRNFR
jgi:hypothetical protein